MTLPRVQVLLATFNGERFLREQLRSVLAQEAVDLEVMVRDDGSADTTGDILAEFASRLVVVSTGSRLGLPAAYFRLIDESTDDVDFVALADQDDVWATDKLARAVAKLDAVKGPAMYCSRVAVTDEDLNVLYLHELPRRGPSFSNALVQNIALGCTTVLNRAARDLVRGRWPSDCVMHDAWLYLVVSGCGTVVYDDFVSTHYRQHSANSVGMGASTMDRLRGRIARQLSENGPRKHTRQDRELQRIFDGDLTPEARVQLARFLRAQRSLWGRARYAAAGPAHRQTRGSDLVLKALQIAGRV